MKCVVFDFGGGTLDVTVLNILNDKVDVLSYTGDPQLGGQDIDNSLMDHCIKEFIKSEDIDLSNNKQAKERIR